MRIVRSEKAETDLIKIYTYIADRNPRAADVLVQEIDAKFKNLSRFPFIGRERSALAPGLRSVLVGNYVIFYVVEQDRIVVVRILDGRTDIDEEFKR